MGPHFFGRGSTGSVGTGLKGSGVLPSWKEPMRELELRKEESACLWGVQEGARGLGLCLGWDPFREPGKTQRCPGGR